MSETWYNFWSNYRRGEVNSEADLFFQIGKTINKKPIPQSVFDLNIIRITKQLQLSPRDHLFEFCCGNGLVTRELARLAGRITATDFVESHITTARNWKTHYSIEYHVADAKAALSLVLGPDDIPTKFLMNFSLAYFVPNDLDIILKNIKQHLQQQPVLFLLTEIPNFDLKWNFYNTPERRARHLENEKNPENTNDGLGRWWRDTEIEDICRKHGLTVSLEDQPPELSNYRMDALISTPVSKPAPAPLLHIVRPFRVLVFPCGGENAMELHDALSQNVNVEVWGASSRDDHGRHVFRNYMGGVPYIQDAEFLPAFNEMLRRHGIDALFPTHDSVAEYFAGHRNEVACRVIMADDETAKICREKRLIYQRFGDCAFTPRVYATLAEVDSYPVFLKPNIGEGGKNMRFVTTREEASHAIALLPDLVIMENLPGEELTVDCFTDRHGALRFIGPRLRHRVFFGISVNSKTVPLTNEIREMADEINRRLRLRGLWFFQVKKSSDDRFKLMEVCTRTAGTMCLYRQLGVNFPLLSVYDAMDKEVEILANNFPAEVDRALFNCFRLGIDYDVIYLDFDDTLVCRGEVNRPVLMLLYQAAAEGKAVHLLTRHDGDIHQSLAEAKIHPGLFKSIQKLGWHEEKFQVMRVGEKAIFIDNAFAERKKVKSETGMPVFDVDAVPSLLNWRT